VQTPVVADEQALKLAIKTLIDDSDVKPEAVQVIADALENDQITKDYWHTLFDSQGAKDALNQKIYNPQMARLLTLRALVIPDTLQQYLDWLNLKKNLNTRSSNLTIISALEFPSNLRSLLIGFPHITRNLTQILELLTANRSSVSLFYKLGDYIHQYSSDSSFSIFYYQLSAYFEQKNNNIVSKSLFNKAFIGTSSCQEDIFGLTVYKERSRIVQYKADTLPIPVVILLVVCSLCLGVGGGFFIGKSHHNQSASNLPKTANAPEPSSAFSGISQINSSNELALTELPEEIEKKASEEFPTTVKAIKQAVQEIQKNQDIPEEQVIQQITNILGDGGLSLDYEGVIEDKLLKQSDKYNFKKKQWIFAIYSYQQKLGVQEEVGYIKPGGDTAKFLKKQVVEQPKTIPKNLAPN
jgi:hypothetical protein